LANFTGYYRRIITNSNFNPWIWACKYLAQPRNHLRLRERF
jgi:hypothetical protein